MAKTISVKVDGKLVAVQLDTLTRRAWEAQLGKLQHQKYLAEKKKHQIDLQSQRWQFEIENFDRQIMALNSEECKKVLEEAEKKKSLDLLKRHMAQLNAEQIMAEFFGAEALDKFQVERQYIFTAKDDQTYKIIPEGTVFRKEGEDWKPICLIRPRELPLPDFIVAAITSIREEPQTYERNIRR